MVSLGRGDRLPRIVVSPPGPRARALGAALDRYEAPGINTFYRGRPGIPWRAARGANVLDVDGNLYVDLTGGFGVAAVGHRHPAVVAAVRRQAGRLLHGLADVAAHPPRVELARRLAALVPVDDAQVFFAISGAEAVEIALESARLATGRAGIVAFAGAYHGLTLGALAVTSRPAFRRPFAPYLHAHVRRLPFGCPPARLARALRDGRVGCVLVEPILGREGVVLPPAGWLAAVAAACRAAGALLAVDEILTGFGRTGRWFAVDEEGVRPDLLCCGKALGGGLPIAAVVGGRAVLAAWRTPGEALHTATFVAHPLACAAALATLDVLRRERLVARAARLGERLGATLRDRLAGRPGVRAVRGRGLLWGIEVTSRARAARAATLATAQGVLVLAGGPSGRVLQIAPPLSIAPRQLAAAVDVLAEAL